MMRQSRGPGDDDEDPMLKGRGTIANTIAQARASLLDPSRPFTPADALNNRSLFKGHEYGDHRPQTSDCYNIPMRPDTVPSDPQGEMDMGESADYMYSEGGADVYDVHAEQVTWANQPSASSYEIPAEMVRPEVQQRLAFDCTPQQPKSPAPPTRKGVASSPRRSSGGGNRSDAEPAASDEPPAAATKTPTSKKEKKEMPGWLQNALDKLEPQSAEEDKLQACDAILEVISSEEDFRGTQASAARAIQRKIFKLMDSKTARLLGKLGTIALNVTGKMENITSVCKLLFRLSKEESNDTVIGDAALLRAFLKLLENVAELPYDCMIFIGGIFKNAALSSNNRRRLLQLGLIPQLAGLLKMVQSSYKDEPGDSLAQLLVQITACLRNLCTGDSLPEAQSQFVEHEMFDRLAWVLERFSRHEELVLNICRALHKLTINAQCRKALAKAPMMVGQLLHTLVPHANNIPIVVRVSFVLGNVTASELSSRQELSAAGGVDLLIGLLEQFNQKDIELCNSSGDAEGDDAEGNAKTKELAELADVLTKVVRVLANLAIDPVVGPSIACHPGMKLLISILDRRFISSSEELVLNTISAVTNLSFYEHEDNVVMKDREALLHRIKPLLLHPNDEAVVESVRALGNLSREQEARDKICELHMDEVLLMLLDHQNSEVLYSVCGVLTNIAADCKHKSVLGAMDGVQRMIRVIARSATTDVPLAIIACRALFNYCLDAPDESAMEDTEAEALIELLSASVLEADDPKLLEHPQWQELAEVALKLIENMEGEDEEEEEP